MNQNISASIVLYKNDISQLGKAIECLLRSTYVKKLYLVDNSPDDRLKIVSKDPKVDFIFNNFNIGFGAGHNLAIKKAIESGVTYHLIMNPDISFIDGVIENIFIYMEQNEDVGLIMPKILSTNGKVQYLPKLLPSPFDLIIRKIPLPAILKEKILSKYEYRKLSDTEPTEIAIVSGCFSFFRIEVLRLTGYYDENYFMYFEDFDISRRALNYTKNVYFPLVSVIHGYEKGANKNFQLTKIFIRSAITYFNKWGWFIDKERVAINKATLKRLNKEK